MNEPKQLEEHMEVFNKFYNIEEEEKLDKNNEFLQIMDRAS